MSLRGSGGEYLLPRRATGGAYVAPGVERWLSPFPLHCPLLLLECPLLLVPSRLPKYGSVSLVQLGEGGWVWHRGLVGCCTLQKGLSAGSVPRVEARSGVGAQSWLARPFRVNPV